jgi:sulfur-oxidizing protein SoxZ
VVVDANTIRIRARLKSSLTEVQVLMPHPMETGLRSDEAGELVPAHFITDVQIEAQGRLVFAAKLGLAVAQDPLLFFRFRGAQAGDRITVNWVDNLGQRRSGETLIA